MKFIFNFCFFGLLFYLISVFFPDAFHTLVSWVSQVYEFLRGITLMLIEKLNMNQSSGADSTSHTVSLVAWIL